MDITLIIGVIGALLILIGFIANEFGKLTVASFWYDLLNLIGSLCLLYYGIQLSAWPFVVLNSIWALVSFRDVYIRLAQGGKTR